MDKYTTEIIDNLRSCEQILKAFEDKDNEIYIGVQSTHNTMAIGITTPYYINKDTVLAKNLISIIKTEQYKLKQKLKDSLDIGNNTHWEQD